MNVFKSEIKKKKTVAASQILKADTMLGSPVLIDENSLVGKVKWETLR